ncbi:type II toxin-antitoxin system VapC family toxin [Gaopeijia maritima]|uniref:type II toxin-antitoxin system VapC family toxin n=1 Tax=Gaopeijia maritima TaxID=3119007 RepID=UPI0032488455
MTCADLTTRPRFFTGSATLAIAPCVDALLGVVDEVFEVRPEDALSARDLVLGRGVEALSARDAIHVTVMERTGVRRLVSFDRGFDDVAGLERIWT